MGRHDPERRQAIAASLSETTPGMQEKISDDVGESYLVDQIEIELEAIAYQQAASIRVQLKAAGQVPIHWYKDRPHTDENTRIYEALCNLWEADEPLDDPRDDHIELTDQEVEEERLADLWADRFDGPGDYEENDPGSEQLMHDILFGEPSDPKCSSCGMTPTGCSMAGCGAWIPAPTAAIDNPSDLDGMLDE